MNPSLRPCAFCLLPLLLSTLLLTPFIQAQSPAPASSVPTTPEPEALEPDSNLTDAGRHSWSIGAIGEGSVRHLGASGPHFMQVDSDGQAHMVFGGDGLYYAYQQRGAWQVETIETDDGVGHGASLALDSQGRPVISYCDDTGPALKLARWTGEFWNIEWVEAVPECGATAVALDATDRPHIVYQAIEGTQDTAERTSTIRYATRDKEGWRSESLAQATGFDLALTPDGQPRVIAWGGVGACYDSVLFASRNMDGWQFETAYTTPPTSGWSDSWVVQASLDLDAAGRPAIAVVHAWWYKFGSDGSVLTYRQKLGDAWADLGSLDGHDATAGILALDAEGHPDILYISPYAYWDGWNYLHWTGSEWVDRPAITMEGNILSTAFLRDERDELHVGYVTALNDGTAEVQHAVERGGAWSVEGVAHTENVGGEPQMVRDARGQAHVAYRGADAAIYYAFWNGDMWEKTRFDAGYGGPPALAVATDNRVFVAYLTPDRTLKLAQRIGGEWTTQIVALNILGAGAAPFALTVARNGKPILCYFDATGTVQLARQVGLAWETDAVPTAEPGGRSGVNITLAVDEADIPTIVTAFPEHNGLLEMVRWDGASWQYRDLDAGVDDVGIALKLDNAGRALVAYAAQGGLRFGHFRGDEWEVEQLATAQGGLVVRSVALAQDGLGTVHIAYNYLRSYNWETGDVLYTYQREGAWETERVARNVSSGLRLALDPLGRPQIAYYTDRLMEATRLPRRRAPLCPQAVADAGTPASEGGDDVIVRSVDRCADDAHVRVGSAIDLYTSTRYLRTGRSSADEGLEFARYVDGLVFRNIDIPRDAKITFAHLILTPWSAINGPVTLEIAGEETASAADFSPGNAWPDERLKTALRQQWHVPPGGGPAESPDLSRIIQEIVTQDDWRAGGNLALIISPMAGAQALTDWTSVDLDPLHAAHLHITYDVSASTSTPTVTPSPTGTNRLTPTPTATGMPAQTPTPTQTVTPPTFSCEGVTQISVPECAALVDLYETTDGPSWPRQGGWLASPNPCDWEGVYCHNKKIWYLGLAGRGLHGPIPPTINQFIGLQRLDLSNNTLTGPIPAALGYIPSLLDLDLSDNQLEGEILPDLCNIHYLQRLDLSNNHLSGPIIPGFHNLIWLDVLDLSMNRFSGEVPAYLARNFYAGGEDVRVDLSSNQFTGIVPVEFCTPWNINILGLAYNALGDGPLCLDARWPGWRQTQTAPPANVLAVSGETGSVRLSWQPIPYTADGGEYEVSYAPSPADPFVVAGMTGDKTASSFTVTGLDPSAMYTFRVRTFTPHHDTQQNDLWSEFAPPVSIRPDGVFCNHVADVGRDECEALRLLFAAAGGEGWQRKAGWSNVPQVCAWEGVSCSDGHVAALRLPADALTGALSPAVGKLKWLHILDLSDNALSGRVPPELGGLSALEVLDLSQNLLEGALPTEIAGLDDLRRLDLSRNAFTGMLPPEIGELAKLTHLVLHHNEFSEPLPQAITRLFRLQVLDASDNRFAGPLTQELGSLRALGVLDLARNRLTGAVPESLGDLNSLTTLDLSENALTGALPGRLCELHGLGSGALDYNGLVGGENCHDALFASWRRTQTTAPGGLRATAFVTAAVQLDWTPIPYVEDGGGYEVSYATDAAGPFLVGGTTPDKTVSTFAVRRLVPATAYVFRVRTFTPAHDGQQNVVWSEWSEPVRVTTGAEPDITRTWLPIVAR